MKINWTTLKESAIKRLKNPATYIGALGVITAIGETTKLFTVPSSAMIYVNAFIVISTFIGILTDTSTPGFKDVVAVVEQVIEEVDPKDSDKINGAINIATPIVAPIVEQVVNDIKK